MKPEAGGIRERLIEELAPLPVAPELPYAAVLAAARRRTRRRRAWYGAIAAGIAAAVVVGVLAVGGSAPHRDTVGPAAPGPTSTGAGTSVVSADVDGDGRADRATLSGRDDPELTVQATRLGRLRVRIPLDGVGFEPTGAGADVNGDGRAELVLTRATASGRDDVLVTLVGRQLAVVHLVTGAPWLLPVGIGTTSTGWMCVGGAHAAASSPEGIATVTAQQAASGGWSVQLGLLNLPSGAAVLDTSPGPLLPQTSAQGAAEYVGRFSGCRSGSSLPALASMPLVSSPPDNRAGQDVDGDGRPDAWSLTGGSNSGGVGVTDPQLTLVGSRIGTVVVRVPGVGVVLDSSTTYFADLDGDGRAEVVLQTDAGFEFAKAVGNSLEMVTGPDGRVFTAALGVATDRASEGQWSCANSAGVLGLPGRLIVAVRTPAGESGGSSGSGTVSTTTYRWSGSALVLVSHKVVRGEAADQIWFPLTQESDCGAIRDS